MSEAPLPLYPNIRDLTKTISTAIDGVEVREVGAIFGLLTGILLARLPPADQTDFWEMFRFAQAEGTKSVLERPEWPSPITPTPGHWPDKTN